MFNFLLELIIIMLACMSAGFIIGMIIKFKDTL